MDPKRENMHTAIIKEILDTCDKVPAVNEALSGYFLSSAVPTEQRQSAAHEMRAAMDEYKADIVEAVLEKVTEDIGQEWLQFQEKRLKPLQDAMSKQDETIKYVVRYHLLDLVSKYPKIFCVL